MKHIKLFENWQDMNSEESYSDEMDWNPIDAGDPPIDAMTRQEMLDYLGLEETQGSLELTDEQLRDAVREKVSSEV